MLKVVSGCPKFTDTNSFLPGVVSDLAASVFQVFINFVKQQQEIVAESLESRVSSQVTTNSADDVAPLLLDQEAHLDSSDDEQLLDALGQPGVNSHPVVV